MIDYCEEEFNKKSLDLFNISEIIGDDWILNENESKIYLSKKRKLTINKRSCKDQEDEDILTIEYHVLFHNSYQIPALYFNAYLSSNFNNINCIDHHDLNYVFLQMDNWFQWRTSVKYLLRNLNSKAAQIQYYL